jgi:rare lipoprotein A
LKHVSITAAALLSAIATTTLCRSVSADPFFTYGDSGTDVRPAARAAIGTWTTTTIIDLSADAAPTAAAWAPPSNVTTGSLRQAEHNRPLPGPRLTGTGHALSGVASYYWQEQMTATGEHFNKRDMTAAHKTLPFGTRVRVTRVDTGKAVVVRINDRGPYKPGRIIDLSERAAENLGMTSVGTTPVKLEVLGQ